MSIRLSLTLAIFAATAAFGAGDPSFEQGLTSDPFFPTRAYFHKHFAPPDTLVQLAAPVRLTDYVAGGKLELSLKNYLELVMANNTEIAVQKVSVQFNTNAVTRAFGIFDPLASASFAVTRALSPSGSTLAGASKLNQLTQPLSLSYQQLLPTGTSFNIGYTDTKLSTNSTFSVVNPQLNSALNFNVAQPLLRGRGSFITKLPISIARSRLRGAGFNLQDQVMQLVSAAENTYWDVVGARESLRVQEESLKLSDAALKRANKELELGATSPLEIFQPQANYANAQIFVTQARYQLAETEDAFRKQIGADLDPAIRDLPIVLTETVNPPEDAREILPEEAIERAIRLRPDLKFVRESLEIDDLGIRLANNNLRPNLLFSAQYGSSGLGGISHPTDSLGNMLPAIPGGIGDALRQVFGFSYPVYGAALTLQLPIRDRRASADLSDATVQKRLDALHERSVMQSIRLQVLTAIKQLQNDRESVRLARVARDLAQKRVDADQKRYELGTTTLFFVLASESDFTVAESALVSNSIRYYRDLTNLLLRTGQLLEERGIVVQ